MGLFAHQIVLCIAWFKNKEEIARGYNLLYINEHDFVIEFADIKWLRNLT